MKLNSITLNGVYYVQYEFHYSSCNIGKVATNPYLIWVMSQKEPFAYWGGTEKSLIIGRYSWNSIVSL